MSDFLGKVAVAKQRVSLVTVMAQHGRDPEQKKCPYCEDKGSKLFKAKASGEPAFKCFHSDCPTGGKVFDQVTFLQFELGLATWQEAAIVFIKEAAPELWREQPSPSLMPGKAGRKPKLPRMTTEGTEGTQGTQRTEAPHPGPLPIAPLTPQRGEGEIEDLPVAEADAFADAAASAMGHEESVPSADPLVVPAAPSRTGSVRDDSAPSNPDAPTFSGEGTQGTEGTQGHPLTPALSPTGEREMDDKPLAETVGEGKTEASSLPASPPAVSGAPVPEPPSPAVAALRWFYTRLQLDARDRDRLWTKRGLHAPTVAALGYRSNVKANKDILLAMEQEFPMLALLDSGLWVQSDSPTEPPKPNAQYYGMALVPKLDAAGKKVRDREGDPIVDCVWDELGPILIPYFDAEGDLVHLRPHKGMMRGRTPRFYMVRAGREYRAAHPDFKPGYVACAALPGITMAKTLFGDIEDWLEGLHAQYAVITEGEFKGGALWQTLNGLETTVEPPAVRSVIVAYDNEDKSNPALPGYQDDLKKRFDAEVWARYLARQVSKEGYEGKVAHLPDAWRDSKGKADWDGRLSARLQELQVTDFASWKKHHPALRAEFEAVLKKALLVKQLWQADLFANEEERVISNRLEWISWERKLPIGGEDEVNMARRLQRLVPRLKRTGTIPDKDCNFLYLLAKNYQAVDDGYYTFKKLTEKLSDKWLLHLAKASEQSDADLKRACEIVLLGVPTRVSDFFLKAQNVLVRVTGERLRLVSIHNMHGVRTKLVKLPSENFAAPQKFREWLLNNISGGTWMAGERELQALQMDIGRELAHKEIYEVAVRGHHADSKCWFFGDVVYLPDGREQFADKNGNVWVKADGEVSLGYKLSEHDHEGQEFCHGTPLMRPKVEMPDAELKEFFEEMCIAFERTLGDYTAFLFLGCLFASGAGPEIYQAYTGVPGLWVHGETRQGKSSVVRWGMKIWGFNVDQGLPLADSTKVGLSIALQQYGELVVWLEEFQPSSAAWLIEKIKNVHNRESGIKKTFDEGRRKILSTAIVTGVATCTDAQVKSRFVHVQVASKNRKADLYSWFQKNSARFYVFGRHIMRHRKEFAEKTLAVLRAWYDEDLPGLDGRARLVYGASYAAFVAFNEIAGSPFGEALVTGLKNFAVTHAAESVKAVNEQVNVNLFWRVVLEANASGAFGETPAERKHVFKWVPRPGRALPESVTAHQLQIGADHTRYAWVSGDLFFKPGVLLDMLLKHLRQRGQNRSLEQADLMAQMRTREYFLYKAKGHYMTFGSGSKVQEYCWGVNVDRHELGLRPVSDEEFEASLHPEPTPALPDTKDIWLAEDKWVDPRKGDLFALIQSLEPIKNGGDGDVTEEKGWGI